MGTKSKTTTALPEYMESYLRETVYPYAQNLANTPMQSYAPLSDSAGAGDIYTRMAGVGAMTPEDYQSLISRNMGGFQTNVIDPTMAAMERRFAQQRVGESGNVIGAGAFDSSRRGVYEGEREAARDVNMAQTIANLQSQGYTQAASQTMAQMASQQASDQAALQMQYNEFLRQQGYPLQVLSALQGMPSYGAGTTTQTQSPNILGSIAALGQLFAL